MRQNHNLTVLMVQKHYNRYYMDADGDLQVTDKAWAIYERILKIITTPCLFRDNHACGIDMSCKDCATYRMYADEDIIIDID